MQVSCSEAVRYCVPKTVKATLYAPLFIGCEAVNGPPKAKVTRAEGQYAMVIAPSRDEGDSALDGDSALRG